MNYTHSISTVSVALLFILVISSACRKKELSSLVDQDAIYMDYTLTYNDWTNQTYVQARFFLDDRSGKRIRLSQNSQVFYGNTELESNTRRGTRYDVTLDGFRSGEALSWNDTEDKEYVNYVDIPAFLYFNSQSINSWSYFWGYDLYWQGDSIGPNEEVRLRVEVDQDTSFSFDYVERDPGARFIHIPSWHLEELVGYTADITLTRTRFGTLQEVTAAGGELTTSYTAAGGWLAVW